MSLYPKVREQPRPKSREELVVDCALLIQALMTVANLSQDPAILKEVDGALRAVGIEFGGAEVP